MAKQKKITREKILVLYSHHILTNGVEPTSIYKFATDNGFEESEFYNHFSSFKNLTQNIFKAYLDNALSVIQKSEDYNSYETKNKLLTFYFTFFEILTANRSFVIKTLGEQPMHQLKNLESLKLLRKDFQHYIETLDFKLPNVKQQTISDLQEKSLKESAWIHLMASLKFWIDDTSPSFEKTDIFIEKSVSASLDIIDISPLKTL